MQDLTPKILESSDTTGFDRGTGRVRSITRTTYMLGELGPFVAEIPSAEFTDSKLREAIDQKAAALRPFA